MSGDELPGPQPSLSDAPTWLGVCRRGLGASRGPARGAVSGRGASGAAAAPRAHTTAAPEAAATPELAAGSPTAPPAALRSLAAA